MTMFRFCFLLLLSGIGFSSMKINDDIKVINVYKDALKPNDKSVGVKTAWVKENDLLVLVISSSNKVRHKIPKGFDEVIDVSRKDLSLSISVKLWEESDPEMFEIRKTAKKMSVALIALRGPRLLIDAFGDMNTGKGSYGLAVAPRVEGIRGGAVISAFAYSEPYRVKIQGMKNLVRMNGMAVGIGETRFDYKTKPIKAFGKRKIKGVGSDIAVALTVY